MDKYTAGVLVLGGTALWLAADALAFLRARDRRAVSAAFLALLAAGGAMVCLVVRP